MSGRQRVVLGGIFALGVAIRVYFAAFSNLPWYSSDSYGYMQAADSISQGGWKAHFPVGYPLILSFVQVLVPEQRVDDVVIGLNVAMSLCLIYVAFTVTRQLTFSAWPGLLAAGIVAIWPNQLNYVRFLLSEVPSAFLLGVAIWCAARRRWIPGGMAFAAAGLVRSTLVPVWGFYLLWLCIGRRMRDAGLIACGMLVVFLPVVGLSLARTGGIELSGNTASNILAALNSYGGSLASMADEDEWRFPPQQFAHRNTLQMLKTYVAAHVRDPGYFFSQRALSLWELWGPWATAENRGTAKKIVIGLRFPLLILGVAGFILYRKRHPDMPDALMLCALVVVSVTIVHTLFFSAPRFTFPAEVPLVMVACAAWCPQVRNRCTPERDMNPSAPLSRRAGTA